jgi:hypothetical protein
LLVCFSLSLSSALSSVLRGYWLEATTTRTDATARKNDSYYSGVNESAAPLLTCPRLVPVRRVVAALRHTVPFVR